MCVFSFAFFFFQKIFLVSRLSGKPYPEPWSSSEESPEHNITNGSSRSEGQDRACG